MKKFKLPTNVNLILNTLKENNFEGYIVGGCVRDLIMGNTPKDYDITTNATTQQVNNLFKDKYKVVPTGIDYGTMSVIINEDVFEITTFRCDFDYTNNRRPKTVKFTNDLKQDLLRRDFTVNALAYNENKGVIDIYDGVKDIQKKLIRCVGNPNERFREDALRILRGYRFASRYDFSIEEKTKISMLDNMNLLNNISKERIVKEIKEIFENGADIYKLDFIKTIFPIINDCFKCNQNNKYHMQSVGDHIYKAFNNIQPKFDLKLAMLLHDIGKTKVKTTDTHNIDHFYTHSQISWEMAKIILKDLKIDNKTRDKVLFLIKEHDTFIDTDKTLIKQQLRKWGEENFFDLIKVRIADDSAKTLSLVKCNIDRFKATEKKAKEIINSKEPYKLQDLKIDGKDLINIGLNGKEIGNMLNILLDIIINDPSKNEKKTLLNIIKEMDA